MDDPQQRRERQVRQRARRVLDAQSQVERLALADYELRRAHGGAHGCAPTVTLPLPLRAWIAHGASSDARTPSTATRPPLESASMRYAPGGTTAVTSPVSLRNSSRSAAHDVATSMSPRLAVACNEKPQKPSTAIEPPSTVSCAEPRYSPRRTLPLETRTVTATLSGTESS